MSEPLVLHPISLRQARAFVARHHRHNRAPRGGLFAVSCRLGEGTAGVAVVGRPVARALQDGLTCEVLRVCVLPGLPAAGAHANCACSLLYGAARRAAKALGYRRAVTYTRADEPGTSLRAAGWTRAADCPAHGWDCPSRRRPAADLFGVLRPEAVDKVRWECVLAAAPGRDEAWPT